MDIVNDTPELRARIDAHNAEAIALHIPTAPVTWIDCMVEADDGVVVHEHREKANSWVRNFYNLMAMGMLPALSVGSYGAGSLALKNTDGANKVGSTSYPASFGTIDNIKGPTGSNSTGIVIGTGTNAESFNDYILQSIIANGTNTGQMSYQAGTIGAGSYDSATKKWTQTITRIFNNNSTSSITVTETGIIGNANAQTANASTPTLFERNLLATPVTVPAAYKLTVTYTTEMTFPA